MKKRRPIAEIRDDIYSYVGDDYPLLGLLIELEDAAIYNYITSSQTAKELSDIFETRKWMIVDHQKMNDVYGFPKPSKSWADANAVVILRALKDNINGA
jgi:hypothetical protein